jgi:predicted flap endonuclease-1-like 5' DNA nuclease
MEGGGVQSTADVRWPLPDPVRVVHDAESITSSPYPAIASMPGSLAFPRSSLVGLLMPGAPGTRSTAPLARPRRPFLVLRQGSDAGSGIGPADDRLNSLTRARRGVGERIIGSVPNRPVHTSGEDGSVKIEEIEGIGTIYAGKLTTAGVDTTDELLARGATPAGRKSLEGATGIDHTLILEWVNHADLMRIDGVGSEYSDLLEAAGVDSPAELAQRNAVNLAETVQEVVAARPNIVRRIPGQTEIEGWIAQSKNLPKVVEH